MRRHHKDHRDIFRGIIDPTEEELECAKNDRAISNTLKSLIPVAPKNKKANMYDEYINREFIEQQAAIQENKEAIVNALSALPTAEELRENYISAIQKNELLDALEKYGSLDIVTSFNGKVRTVKISYQ